MRSNYRNIGELIHLVDKRNKGLKVTKLLGLTIAKKFIPSVANIIGTDMENYKIIRKNQFACSLMQVRRDKKMPVALLEKYDEAIISQAYPVFEVNDEKELLPEYLMMRFTREEFDREACFYAVGGVRGSLEREDFCNMKLPVPDIIKQQEIYDEYNSIKNRIALNNNLIEKLEESAQAIYREWFVDFEFPDENGNPYKSSGGEMDFCSELEMDVPKGWKVGKIKDFVIDMKNGATPLRDVTEYWDSNDIPWIKTGEIHNNILVSSEEYISEKGFKNSSTKLLPVNTVLMAMYGVTAGQVGFLKFEATTNQACCAMICENINKSSYLYYFLLLNQDEIASMANGGAQANLSKNLIEELTLIQPNEEIINNSNLSVIVDFWHKKTQENENLGKIKDLILSKMASES